MKKFIVVLLMVLVLVFVSQNKALTATPGCPDGRQLITHAWSLFSLPLTMQEEAKILISTAKNRDTRGATDLNAYQGESISRTLGSRLRHEVKIRAPIADDIQVRYLDAHSGKLLYDIGVARLTRGAGSFRFSDDPREFVVETVWPTDFISPTMSGGERRLRLFPKEWGKWCTMNLHGIVP